MNRALLGWGFIWVLLGYSPELLLLCQTAAAAGAAGGILCSASGGGRLHAPLQPRPPQPAPGTNASPALLLVLLGSDAPRAVAGSLPQPGQGPREPRQSPAASSAATGASGQRGHQSDQTTTESSFSLSPWQLIPSGSFPG